MILSVASGVDPPGPKGPIIVGIHGGEALPGRQRPLQERMLRAVTEALSLPTLNRYI